MKKKQIWNRVVASALPIVILGLGVAGLFILVRRPPQASEVPPKAQPPLVQTVAVTPHTGPLTIEIDGTVVPYREIDVASEVGGRIAKKSDTARAGHFVSEGTLLYQIDRRDYELDIERLTAMLEQADANLDQLAVEIANSERLLELAAEDLELVAKEVKRLSNLSGSRFVSDSELDRAKQRELAARNARTTLSNQLALANSRRGGLLSARRLAETQLSKARLDLQRTEVRATVDGVVVSDPGEVNSYVQPGTVLATIEDTSAVEVICNLKMEELSWLWRQRMQENGEGYGSSNIYEIPKTPVTVKYRYNDRPSITYAWDGRVTRFDGVGLDEQTRTVPCRVLVEDPSAVRILQNDPQGSVPPAPTLVRGMYVTVSIHLQPDAQLVRVDEAGLRPGRSVWVARDNQLRLIQPVHLVEFVESEGADDDYWVVDAESSGLHVGDRLIISPMVVVNDKMPIRQEPVATAGELKQDEVDYPLGDS